MFSANSNQSGVDATTDPYFKNTILLLSGDGTTGTQNNTFVDSSVNNATITRANSPTQGSFSPFSQTGWSGYFNGTSALQTPASSITSIMGTNGLTTASVFTVECWMYSTARGSNYIVGDMIPTAGTSNWSFGPVSSGAIALYWYNGTGYTATGSTITPLNTWIHIALVINGTNIKIYVNGTLETLSGQTTSNGAATTTGYIAMGEWNNGGATYGYSGYVNNLRIVKGVVVYTGNFTPPIGPLTATQSAGTNIAAITGTATGLLTLQDNRFKDNSTNAFSFTATGTPSVQAFSPFAPTMAYSVAVPAGSAYFNGSSYLSYPVSITTQFGSSNFTIEVWLYVATLPNTRSQITYLNANSSGYAAVALHITSTNKIGLSFSESGGSWTTDDTAGKGSAITAATWQHIALVRTGQNIQIYLNGVAQGTPYTTTAVNTSLMSTYTLNQIGAYNTSSFLFNGYLSNFRIVKDTAVYTGSFTPPGTPLSKIQSAGTNIAALSGTETSLLTLQDSTFKDNSVNVATITASATPPMIKSFTPFTQVWGGYFGGSSYLQAPVSANLALGTGNFTVEAWVYLNSVTGIQGIYSSIDTSGDSWQGVVLGINGTSFQATSYIIAADIITHQNTVVSGTWYHVAIVRNGSITKSYLNGIQSTSTTTGNYNLTQSGSTIGSLYPSSSPLNGYISNLRVVKGTAVYTGNFTPPTKTLSATQVAGTNISAIYPGQTSLLTLQDPTFKDNAAISNVLTLSTTAPSARLVSAPFTSADTMDPVNGSGSFAASEQLTSASIGTSIGTNDFSMECWVNVPNAANGYGAAIQLNVSTGYNLYIQTHLNTLRVLDYNNPNGSNFVLVGGTINNNTWYHLLLTRQSSTIRGFINGNLTVNQAGVTASYGTAGTCQINAGLFASNISNVRVVLGNVPTTYQTSSTTNGTQIFTPSTTPLTAVTGTSLLTLQDTTFIDKATPPNLITASGTPVMRAFTPFTSNWGGSFDGTSNLAIPAGAPFNLTTVDFCIEMWVYPIAQSTYGALLSFDVQDYPLMFQWAAAGSANIRFYAGSSTAWISGTPLDFGTTVLNTWAHICVTRTSGVFRTFKNGVLSTVLAGQESYSIGDSVGSVYVGSNGAAGGFSTAYISNLRIIKGTGNVPAAYQTSSTTLGTAIFTPPTAPLTAVTGTSLLTLQDSTFKDNATPPNTITPSGAPKTQLLQLPFTSSITKVAAPWNISVTEPLATVGGSMYFNGTSDYLTLPSSTAFDLSTGNFTIEMWIYPTAAGLFLNKDGAASVAFPQYDFSITALNKLQFSAGAGNQAATASTTYIGITTVTYNTWHHVAAVKIGTTIKVFLDGVLEVSATQGAAIVSGSRTLDIGINRAATVVYWKGYIANLRIVKGTAVYTTSSTATGTVVFAPPIAPSQPTQNPGLLGTNINAVEGTSTSVLLLGTNAGIYDATAKNDIITIGALGGPKIDTTTFKYGTGSIYFNGTTDYLLSPTSPMIALGNADFTIEFWEKAADTANRYCFAIGSDWAVTTGVCLVRYSGAYGISGPGTQVTGIGTLTSGTWKHIALSRYGGYIYLYIDGVNTGSMYVAANSITDNYYKIGTGTAASWSMYSGYIDDLRITKGIARYTTPFTPPTQGMIGQ